MLRRTQWTAPLAALLLVLQGIAGGVVPLAHAAEPFSAPAHIEAQHGSGCLAVHDELRCVLCQYAATRVIIERSDAPFVATLRAEAPYDRCPVAPRAPSHRPTPRAPLPFVADPASRVTPDSR